MDAGKFIWKIKEQIRNRFCRVKLRRYQKKIAKMKEELGIGFSSFLVLKEMAAISELEKILDRDLDAEYMTRRILEQQKNTDKKKVPKPEQKEADWDYENPKLESYTSDLIKEYGGCFTGIDPEAESGCVMGNAVEWMGYSYTPLYVTVYKNRVVFDLMKKLAMTQADYILELEEQPRLKAFELSREAESRHVEFELDGARWRLDCWDKALRLLPEWADETKPEVLIPELLVSSGESLEELQERAEKMRQLEENPVAALLDEAALWVERELAERTLTPECRAYSFKADDRGYYWCVADGSFLTVWNEMKFIGDHEIYMDEADRAFGMMKGPEDLWQYGKSYYETHLRTMDL